MHLSELRQSIADFQDDYENLTIVLNLGDEAESNIQEIYSVLAQYCDENEDEVITQETFNELLTLCNSSMSEMDKIESVHDYFQTYFQTLAVACGLSMSDNNNNNYESNLATVKGFEFVETMGTYASDNLDALIGLSGLEGTALLRPIKRQMTEYGYAGSYAFEQTIFGSSKESLPPILNLNNLLNCFLGQTESKKLSITQTVSQDNKLQSLLTSVDSLGKLLKAFEAPSQVEVMKMIGMEKIQSLYQNREAEMDALLNQMSDISKSLRPSTRMSS